MLKSILFGLLLYSVASALEEDACETSTMQPNTHEDDLDYLGLKELFMRDDITKFTEETNRQSRDDRLDDEDMVSMFTSVDGGSLPDFVKGRGFELIENQTGQYAYSDGNKGFNQCLIYGKLDQRGKEGNYTSIAFTSVEGKLQQKTYKTGTCIYGRVHYLKDDFGVQWTAFSNGIFLLRLPKNKYYVHGAYGGYTHGEIQLLRGPKLKFSGITLGATDTLQFNSKSVTNLLGTLTLSNNSHVFDMTSLTGGTNVTMRCHTKVHPESPETTTAWNGTLSKDGRNVAVNFQASGYALTDKRVLFSDTNLKNIFHLMYSSVGLYLP